MSLDKIVYEWICEHSMSRHLSLRDLATTAYRAGMRDADCYRCDLGWALARMREGKILMCRSIPGWYYWLDNNIVVASGYPDKDHNTRQVTLSSFLIEATDWAEYGKPIE